MEELDELVFWVEFEELFIVLLEELIELVVLWFPEELFVTFSDEILQFPVELIEIFDEFVTKFVEFVIDEFMFDKFVEEFVE